jgi:hypothetical protein
MHQIIQSESIAFLLFTQRLESEKRKSRHSRIFKV